MEDLLCILASDAPLALFLDDAHFADEPTLEVIRHLLDREEGRVVVYAAAPSEALAESEEVSLPLVRLLPVLRQSPSFVRPSPAPKTLPKVTQMVTEILDRHTASPDFIQHLHGVSQGIPLFVEEELKGRIAKGVLKMAGGVWDLDAVEPTAVPVSLTEAVLGGLETLDQEFGRQVRTGRDLSFIMIDIDKFKRVNDRYGHL